MGIYNNDGNYYINSSVDDNSGITATQKLQGIGQYNRESNPTQFLNTPTLRQSSGHLFGTELSRYSERVGDMSSLETGQLSVQESLRNTQTAFGRLNSAFGNFTVTTATAIGSMIGTAIEMTPVAVIANMIAGNNPITKMSDNIINNWMNNIQEYHRRENPVYRTAGYDDRNLGQKLVSSEFWTDLLDSAGYTAGMFLANAGIAAATGGSSLGVTLLSSVLSACAEAGLEGLQNKKEQEDLIYAEASKRYNALMQNADTEEKQEVINNNYAKIMKEAEEDLDKQSNSIFIANTALLSATNAIGWGSALSRGAKSSASIAGKEVSKNVAKPIIKEGAFEGFNISPKVVSVMTNLASRLKEGSSEAFEEFAQTIITNAANTNKSYNRFFESEYNTVSRDLTDGLIKSYFKATGDAFQDPKAAEAALSGFLTSVIGVPMFKRKANGSLGITLMGGINEFIETARDQNRQRKLAEAVNERLSDPKFAEYYRGLVRSMDLQNSENLAILTGNQFDAKNYRFSKLLSDVIMFDNVGQLNAYKEKLKKASNFTDEQIQELITTSINSGDMTFTNNGEALSVEEVRTIINKNTNNILSLIDNYEKDKATLDSHVEKALDNKAYEDYLYAKSHIKDWERRKEEITSEIEAIEGVIDKNSYEEGAYKDMLLNSKEYRRKLRGSLKYNNKLSPDQIFDINQKLEDLDKIDKGIDEFNKKLREIWNDPSSYNAKRELDLYNKRQQAHREERIKAAKEAIQQLKASQNPVALIQDILENSDKVSSEDINTIVDILKESKDQDEKKLGEYIEKAFTLKSDLRNAINKISKDSREKGELNFIETLEVKDPQGDFSTYEDYESAILDSLYSQLNGEQADLLAETLLDIQKTKAIAGEQSSDKSSSEGEKVLENGTEDGSDIEDYNSYDKDELINRIEGSNLSSFYKATIPDYKSLTKSELAYALTKADEGVYNRENPYKKGDYQKSKGGENNNGTSSKQAPPPQTTQKTDINPEEVTADNEVLNTAKPEDKKKGEIGEITGSTVNSEGHGGNLGEGENYTNRGNEDAFAVGRSKPIHKLGTSEEAKDGVKCLRNHSYVVDVGPHVNTNVRTILENARIEEFLNSGKLLDWHRKNRRNGKPSNVVFITAKGCVNNNTGKRVIFAAIEHSGKSSMVVYDNIVNPRKVQIPGVVGNTTTTKEEFEAFETECTNISAKMWDEGNRHNGLLIPGMHTSLAHIFSGRFITSDENKSDNKSKRDLKGLVKKNSKGIITDKIRLVVYTNSGAFYIGNELDGREVPLNTNNPNRNTGTVWLQVREANGDIHHKYVEIKHFNDQEYDIKSHENTYIVKAIKNAIQKIVDNRDSTEGAKAALNDLHKVLQIPTKGGLFVNTKTETLRIEKSGEIDLSSETAAQDVLDLIYSKGYQFNISQYAGVASDVRMSELINSDIFVTDLARLYNAGHSILLNRLTKDDNGNWVEIPSSSAEAIHVHTGDASYQSSKNRAFIQYEGRSIYRNEDGFFESTKEGENEITDSETIEILEYIQRIEAGEIGTKNFYKTRNTKAYVMKTVDSFKVIVEEKSGGKLTYRVLSNEEQSEYLKTLNKKKLSEKSERATTDRTSRANLKEREKEDVEKVSNAEDAKETKESNEVKKGQGKLEFDELRNKKAEKTEKVTKPKVEEESKSEDNNAKEALSAFTKLGKSLSKLNVNAMSVMKILNLADLGIKGNMKQSLVDYLTSNTQAREELMKTLNELQEIDEEVLSPSLTKEYLERIEKNLHCGH